MKYKNIYNNHVQPLDKLGKSYYSIRCARVSYVHTGMHQKSLVKSKPLRNTQKLRMRRAHSHNSHPLHRQRHRLRDLISETRKPN